MSSLLIGLHVPATRLVFGPQYADAAPLIAVLGLSAWLSVLGWAQGAVVLAGDAPGRAVRASLVVLTCALLLDFALIPTFDAMGAAVATAVTAVVACAVFTVLNRPVLGIGTPYPPLRLVLACVPATAVMLAASAIGRGWWGFAAALTLPVLLLATRAVSASEVQRLRTLVAGGLR